MSHMVLWCIKAPQKTVLFSLWVWEGGHTLKSLVIRKSQWDFHGYTSDELSKGWSESFFPAWTLCCNVKKDVSWYNARNFYHNLFKWHLWQCPIAFIWHTVVCTLISCRLQHQHVHCGHMQRVLPSVHWQCAKGQTKEKFNQAPSQPVQHWVFSLASQQVGGLQDYTQRLDCYFWFIF